MVVLFLVLSALAAPPVSSESTYVRDLLPHQGWPALQGATVGLLVEGGSHEWGTPVGWTGNLDKPNYCAYRYVTGGHAPWAVYFEVPDRTVGYNALTHWTAGGAWETGLLAAMLCGQTGGLYGLSRPVHVVQLGINHGEPVKPNLHFVATDVKVLDGGREVPMDPDQVLRELRADFDRGIVDRRKAIAALVLRGQQRAERASRELRDAKVTHHDPDPDVRVFPSWDAEQMQLVATFVWLDQNLYQARIERMESPSCPPGAPCVRPHMVQSTVSWPYGVEVAATYRVDARGEVLSVDWHEPRGMGYAIE